MRENDGMNKNNETLKLNIRFEFSIEVILLCLIFILFGLAFLLTSNLLAFNWISVVLILLGFTLIYLKTSSYIELKKDTVTIQYMKYMYKKTLTTHQIKQFVFYKSSLLVEIQAKNQKVVPFYLKQKNRERLLNFLVNHYPDIPCLFYDKTD